MKEETNETATPILTTEAEGSLPTVAATAVSVELVAPYPKTLHLS
jgi:hypothetical protein